MKTGKIMEVGNHQSLLTNYPEGIYSQFVKEQEQAESSHKHHNGVPDSAHQESESSSEEDKYESEEEDTPSKNLLKGSKLHDDKYIERKLSKI
jgi:hypothetical protein